MNGPYLLTAPSAPRFGGCWLTSAPYVRLGSAHKAPPLCMAEARFSIGGEAPAPAGSGPSGKALRSGSPLRWSAFFFAPGRTRRRARRATRARQTGARSASSAIGKNHGYTQFVGRCERQTVGGRTVREGPAIRQGKQVFCSSSAIAGFYSGSPSQCANACARDASAQVQRRQARHTLQRHRRQHQSIRASV
jgi:hypothetical protein